MSVSLRAVSVVCVCAFACVALSASTVDREPPRFASEPFILRNPNPKVPLTAPIRFTTDEPATVSLESMERDRRESRGARRGIIFIPVLGLRPGRLNQVRLFLTDTRGNVSAPSASLQIETPPLPDDFPPLKRAFTTKRVSNRELLFSVPGVYPDVPENHVDD